MHLPLFDTLCFFFDVSFLFIYCVRVLIVMPIVLLLPKIIQVECWYRTNRPLMSDWSFSRSRSNDPTIEAGEFVKLLRVQLKGITTVDLA